MNYVNEVSAVFQQRCPNVTIISPDDYRMIAEWEKQEIPIEIIADTINAMCDTAGPDTVEIRSIGYFHPTIKNNFITWLQAGTRASDSSGQLKRSLYRTSNLKM